MSTEPTNTSGVQELIEKLHEEGVAKGQAEADQVVSAARREAMAILDKAQQEAESLLDSAREEAQRTRAGGEEAVRLAGRDAILQLTEELREDFVRTLRRLVGQTLDDREFLKQLILEIARKAVPAEDTGPLTVQFLADHTDHETSEALNQFVLSLGGEALREGLKFEVAEHDVPGVRVQVVNEDLEIDLTTETLTHLLVRQLSPRFRDIVEGHPQS